MVSYGKQHVCELYPAWLYNQGQNVLGFLPKMAVSLSLQGGQYYQTLSQWADFNPLIAYPNHQTNPSSADEFYQFVIDYQDKHQTKQINSNADNGVEHVNFTGGLIGFMGYDVGARQLDSALYRGSDDNKIQGFFADYHIYLTCQEQDEKFSWTLHGDLTASELINIHQLLQKVIKLHITTPAPLTLTPHWQKADYAHAFNQVQDYLIAGDCYQINLTQCWRGKSAHRLADYLTKLHHATHAPFAGYLAFGEFELLSCSPELFFYFYQRGTDSKILTKPIKGTRPRSPDPQQDERYRQELANSDKDISENLMIVDLLRNDLGKYAKVGTVKTPRRFAIESFASVHHMVSTITATLQDGVSPLRLLFDSLPAGSITGTPKKRACQIIAELESHERGAYCGTLGFMNADGTGQFNVLIRTLQATGDLVELWAGGGITIGSNLDDEYQECWHKVGKIVDVLGE